MIALGVLLSAMAPGVPTSPVGVERIGASNFFYTPVQGRHGLVNRWEITELGATGLGILRELEIRAITAINASEWQGGGTWNTMNVAGTYQSNIHWAKAPGAYAEITFNVAPGEVVGLVNFKSTNGGIGHVTIDGSKDLPNLLPADAQGNRMVDFYSSSGPTPNLYCKARKVIPIAKDLLPGSHTIRIAVSGQKSPGASDVRILLDALAIYRETATEEDTVAGDFCVLNSTALTASGAWETVFRIDGMQGKWFGSNQHGSETPQSVSLNIDSFPEQLDQYEFVTGSTVSFDVTSVIEDPQIGVLAQNRRSYSFTPEGLDLGLKTLWITPRSLSLAYTAMFPLLDNPEISGFVTFKYGTRSFVSRSVLDLSRNTGDMRGGYNSRIAVVTNANHPRTFTMEITDVDERLDQQRFWVWDLAAPAYNKLYFQRQDPDYVPTPGEVWQSTAKYRCTYDTVRFSGY